MDNILARKIQLRHNIDPCKPTGSTSMQGRNNTETSWKKKLVCSEKKLVSPDCPLPRTSNLEPRTSDLEPRTSYLEPRTSDCFCVFPSLHGCWACWFTWVYVVSQLDLPCQDVVHNSPPCWVYVGSATMTLGLGWVYVYFGSAMLGLYVGLCWICWDVHKSVAKLALGP